jgi:two-component system CheB/CheR fusion protein
MKTDKKKAEDILVSKTSENKAPNTKENNDFPIVAIGTSAGGLETLEQFFSNMPDGNGMAFIIIQHLAPDHIGMMPELLQRITTMKVYQVIDGIKVKPNSIYVIPPNKSMSILNDTLYLFATVETHGIRLPIDIFFRSLANDRQEKSIGIILSGMGSDGSLGIKAIKEKNGIVLVQEPSSAKFDGMPRSAIQVINPDIIAPVQELPTKLIEILQFRPIVKIDFDLDAKNKSNLDKIIILLREQSGHDFSMYKKSTLFRRIERRKSIHKIDNIQNYVRFMQENPKETEMLFNELLIGVTNFFRDPEVWIKFGEQILPEMLEKLPKGYILRAWVPGCSTGEEAYSLAIIFKEALAKIKDQRNLRLQIFATDLDTNAIEKARKGIFPPNIVADVSPERISQFFIGDNEGFRVNATIREMVVFAPQDVIKDPPFTKLDILTCRNMLIYMEADLQTKLMALFNYSLKPGGIMILGSAETLGNGSEGFEVLDAKLKIFKRSLIPRGSRLLDFPSAFSIINKTKPQMNSPKKIVENIQTLADQILLQQFSPASVLVNDKGDIIYITGRTGKYLEPVAGKANWNIYAMLREGLRIVFPATFQKALKTYEPLKINNVKVENGKVSYVNIIIQRLEKPETIKDMILVVFNDVPEIVESKIKNSTSLSKGANLQQKTLELELNQCYDDLQTVREEMQTSQEELKSTNEELQSTNEELQSTNEELTTSKEEMQSLNEELQTVNSELQNKVNDFSRANNDMKNLLNSTEIATLFLDKELNIRRFTDPIIEIFKVRASDIGRPFTDLVTDLIYPELGFNAKLVIKNLTSIETENKTNDGKWFSIKIMPYRTIDDHIDGLVLTFTNITKSKKLEIELKDANESLQLNRETHYRHLFESAKDGILMLDSETGKITDVNPFLIELLGYSKEQFLEKAIWEIGFLKDIVANKEKFKELQKKEIIRYENLPLESSKGKKIYVEFISNKYTVADYQVIQCFIRDITEKKLAEEIIQKNNKRN